MPAGDLNFLKPIMDLIHAATQEFIVLSTHDDVDIVVQKSCKSKVMKICSDHGLVPVVAHNKNCLYGAEPSIHYENIARTHNIIDLHTGLYYNGLVNNTFVPIDEKFQKYVFDTKVATDDIWKYRLAPESDITHTVCRIIFDKRMVMPHYKDRLERLLVECDSSKLGHALNLALFKFGPRALDLVMNKEFDNLFQEYISYSDY